MASLPLKESLLQKLVTFVKHLKLLKLSAVILCIHRHVITLLRRLLHGILHKPDKHLLGQRPSVDSIMGSIQPAVGDTQNQTPVTTLAVRPPETEDAPPFQHCVGAPLSFPSAQVPMDPRPYSVQTSSAVPNVHRPGAITLRAIVASQIGRYDRNITQYVCFVFAFLECLSNTNGRSKNFRVFEVSPGLDNFTE
ncbi:hypothetical protein BDR05DRAFT_969632 [Suillus weaverae]|nr:hypothetical protein BDR05DRAFT_969632 [Suillus weaverae]